MHLLHFSYPSLRPKAIMIKAGVINQNSIAQRQVSEYQEGGMPFGLGYGTASTVVYHASYPESLLS
jgi:hypothetical protein